MSKSIASYPAEQRKSVILRRLAQNSRGNGYWAAQDAARKLNINIPAKPSAPRKKKESPSDERRRERRAHKQNNTGVKLRDFARNR